MVDRRALAAGLAIARCRRPKHEPARASRALRAGEDGAL